ncbi:hypothetical protein FRC01_006632, partial [Tulasnella sp. 417]
MDTKKLHRERHKRWGTPSPWAAEWFAKTVSFCKTQEGKKQFEEWLLTTHGPGIFDQKLLEVYAPPQRRYGSYTGNAKMWNSAAVELGVSDEFLKQAHTFVAGERLCEPERTLPPPVRRRYESSSDWLLRRTDALLMGAKVPSIQWDELRRIAFSEFDHIRDQMEAWRTQPNFFFDGLRERARSTIITPGDAAPGEEWSQACMDAMRSRLHLAQTQYAAWSQAARLFEDFDQMGATTASAALNVIKRDSYMLGRLVGLLCAISELERWQTGKLPQVLTSSEYLRPFFHRTRDQNGISKIYTNDAHARRANMRTNSIELFLANWRQIGGQALAGPALLAELRKLTVHEAAKVTSEALQTIGDLAPASEFGDAFRNSTFATELAKLVEEANRTGVSKTWESLCLAIPPRKFNGRLDSISVRYTSFAEYERSYRRQSLTWLGVIWQLDCRDAFKVLLETDQWGVQHYDWMWYTMDNILWEEAKRLERAPGSVARLYGLIAPDDKNRPLATKSFMDEVLRFVDEVTASEKRREQDEMLRASFVQHIPTATHQDSVAKGPERNPEEPKVKVRKRRKGKQGLTQPEETLVGTEPFEPQGGPSAETKNAAETTVPDLLPMEWKLGRKTVDILHRLLDPKEKSGQMRWAEFEN